MNILSKGFVAGEKCCHRRCSKDYYRCIWPTGAFLCICIFIVWLLWTIFTNYLLLLSLVLIFGFLSVGGKICDNVTFTEIVEDPFKVPDLWGWFQYLISRRCCSYYCAQRFHFHPILLLANTVLHPSEMAFFYMKIFTKNRKTIAMHWLS